jgi:epoxyqueuosine reductase
MLDELRSLLLLEGAAIIGIASLDELPPDVRDDFPVGISIAVALDPRTISGITEGPTRQYYDEYERANKLLERLGNRAGEFLDKRGHRSLPFAVTSVGIDSETISTRLPHKTVATRAGIGWIGKCALLVTKKFGAAIRMTTVLTDARLQTDHPVNADLCGTCSSCVDNCPAHAPSGKNWQIGLHRDEFFNAFACQKNARELASKKIGVVETICGICIAVCPWTQKYVRGTK